MIVTVVISIAMRIGSTVEKNGHHPPLALLVQSEIKNRWESEPTITATTTTPTNNKSCSNIMVKDYSYYSSSHTRIIPRCSRAASPSFLTTPPTSMIV
jgi:hypothetical protein